MMRGKTGRSRTIWAKIDKQLTTSTDSDREYRKSLRAWKGNGGAEPASFTEGQFLSLRAAFRLLNNADGHGAILADDVGLGKTRVALEAVRRVVGNGGRVAIVVPSPLLDQWVAEIEQMKDPFCILRKGSDHVDPGKAGVDCLVLRNVDDLLKGSDCILLDSRLSERARDAQVVLFTQSMFSVRTRQREKQVLKKHARWGYYWDFRVAAFRVAATGVRVQNKPNGSGRQLGRAFKQKTCNWLQSRLDEGCVSTEKLAEFVEREGGNEAIRTQVRSQFLELTSILLGSFDMVVVDEAHKGRGAIAESESDAKETLLTTLIQSLYRRPACRVLALTATPVDIDSTGKGWCQILERIDVPVEHQETVVKTIDAYLKNIEALQSETDADENLQERFMQSQEAFADVMRRFLIRRLQREDRMKRLGCSAEDLSPDRVPLRVEATTPAWAKAICEAEALSFVCHNSLKDEAGSKRQAQRLRLTIGSGHGISRLLDSKAYSADSKKECLEETQDVGIEQDWLNRLRGSLHEASKQLHPALAAVANAVEEYGEKKVLIFGFYVEPIKRLVDLLNVRFYIRQYQTGNRTAIPAGTQLSADERSILRKLKKELGAPSPDDLNRFLEECQGEQKHAYACALYGDVDTDERSGIQQGFNEAGEYPRVLVAQTQIGSEGLNFHRQCSIVIFLHPEWNPRVLEQGVGRVNRIGSLWEKQYVESRQKGVGFKPERIQVREVIFKGTYDEENWRILENRWNRMRAFLDGEIAPGKHYENLFAPELILKTG